MDRIIEIRSYNLKPGTRAAFHDLFIKESLPMLDRWQVDVVAYGPSLHDHDSYYLMCAYATLDNRQQSQDAFYGSPEWRQGPRESIVSLIESYTSIVIEMDSTVVDSLRTRVKRGS